MASAACVEFVAARSRCRARTWRAADARASGPDPPLAACSSPSRACWRSASWIWLARDCFGWGFAWIFQGLRRGCRASRGFDVVGRGLPSDRCDASLRMALDRRAGRLRCSSPSEHLHRCDRLGTNLVPSLSQGEFAFQPAASPRAAPLEASTAQVVERIEDAQFEGDAALRARLLRSSGSLPSTASGRQTLGENLAQVNVRPCPDGRRSSRPKTDGGRARARGARPCSPRVEGEARARPPRCSTVGHADGRQTSSRTICETLDESAASAVESALLGGLPALVDVGSTVEPGSTGDPRGASIGIAPPSSA